MKLLTKIGSIAVVGLLPITLAAPAYAVAYDRLNITVDCVLGETGEDDHLIAPGDVLSVTFTNCDGLDIEDEDDTGNATLPDNTVVDDSGTQTVSGNSFVVTVVGAADLEVDGDEDVDVSVAGTSDNPNSTLLETEEVTLGLSASETMIREAMIGDPVGEDGDGNVLMGGDPNCQVEPGLHVYETLEFRVTENGEYDFRAVAVSPIDEDLNWGTDKYPSSDPFLALYSGFDPSDPEVNIVGCNDDSDDTGIAAIDDVWLGSGDSYDALVTESGDMIDDQWPWFRTVLEPGSYTLVYMPYSTMGTDDFALGQFGPTSSHNPTDNPELRWDPIEQVVTYEIWGPEGGITLGSEELAATGGVEPAFALWAGLGVISVGVAMAVARRRELRV